MRRAVLAAAALLALVAVGMSLFDGRAWFGRSTATSDGTYDPGDDPSVRTTGAPGLRGQARSSGNGPTATKPLEPYVPPTGALIGQVLDPSGAPVEGAEVYLQRASPRGAAATEERDLYEFLVAEREVRATTNAQGRFSIEHAADGRAWLMARSEGYGMRAARVQLRGGQAVGGPVELMLGVGQQVRGRVVDRHGAGVGGVRVASLAHAWGLSPGFLTGLAVSGFDGRFATWVGQADESGSLLVYARPGVRSLVVTSALERGVLRWPRFVDVAVRFVSGAKRSPLGGLSFAIGSHEARGAGQLGCRTWSMTDEAGLAVVPLLAGKLNETSGEHPRTGPFSFDSNEILEAASGGGVVPEGREATLEILVGARTEVTFVGTVRDVQGDPVAGARVVHTNVSKRDADGVIAPLVFSGQGLLGFPMETRTDAEGRFAFAFEASRASKSGTLEVRAPGFAPFEENCPVLAGGTQGEPRRVEVTLTRGVRVTGRVLDANGRPLAGAQVFTSVHDVGWMIVLGRWADSAGMGATTGPDGRYTLRGISPDTDVTVWASHSAGLEEGTLNLRTDQRTLQTAPAIRLKAGRSLRVRVLGPGGLVRPGATVHIVNGPAGLLWYGVADQPSGETARPLTTGPTGEAQFRRLAPGGHCLLVTAGGTAGVAVRVVVEPGEEPQEVTVRLRRSAPITGTVVDHKGRSVAWLNLSTNHPEGAPQTASQWISFQHHTPPQAGRFRLDAIPPGVPVHIRVYSGYYQTAEFTARGGGVPIEIVLVPWDVELLERIEAVAAKRTAIHEKHGFELEAAMAEDPALAAKVRALDQEAEGLEGRHREISGGGGCGASGKS